MSQGPGRIMRAALAELAERDVTGPFSVAQRARHDRECGCADRMCWEEDHRRLSRSELVAARRALHTLAEYGECSLSYQSFPGHDGAPGRWLEAKRCFVPGMRCLPGTAAGETGAA